MCFIKYSFIFVMLLFLAGRSFGQSGSAVSEEMQISLITVGPGDSLPTVAGHTILRIQDADKPLDVSVNFGVFNIAQPGFLKNYLSNHMQYTVVEADTRKLLKFYKTQNRSIWVDRLQLTAAQKRVVLDKVKWWLQPANRYYRYDFVANNCATIVRDILNEALLSKISYHFVNSSGKSVRQLMQGYFQSFPWANLGVNAFFASAVDKNITSYEEMFLPLSLRNHLLKMPAVDDRGHPISNVFLAEESPAVFIGPNREAPISATSMLVLVWISILAGFAGCLYLKGRLRWAVRFLAAGMCLWGAVSFALGSVLVLAWLFTDHTMAHYNAHLWILWPTDLLLVWWGMKMWRTPNATLMRGMEAYWTAHLVALVFVGILWSFGQLSQDISPMILALYLPLVLLASMSMVLRFKYQPLQACQIVNPLREISAADQAVNQGTEESQRIVVNS